MATPSRAARATSEKVETVGIDLQTKRYTAFSMQDHQSNDESSTDTAPTNEFEMFEVALRTLSERVRSDDAFAHDLYGALCNMRWRRRDADTEPVSISWRYAGDVVAHLACKVETWAG